MPIYEYRCKRCGNEFELIMFAGDDDNDIKCPGCGGKKAEKVLSAPAGSNGSCQTCSSSKSSCFT
ncbi:MAG: zinc ribbon domain-containing protein [Deltaproteobacteria bacterium]|nr:zinc ribbon domain-containing protein [Deltaproteobacteria bacterium]MBW2595823.1 zinc ribbon domain-containing protein [Deltaproteobacteria bacterium]MBW2650077.1 zinc ribbon domain-containing protein [Deltaproteobacteria bacterium]